MRINQAVIINSDIDIGRAPPYESPKIFRIEEGWKIRISGARGGGE
jgi:hypothetical protein